MWSRLYLTPLLQAEEDRDQVRRYYADKSREKELLGTESKVYNSDRYVSSPNEVCHCHDISANSWLGYSFIRPTFVYTPKVTQ